MSAHNYLAFDLGAESGRAVLGSLENGKLTLGEIHRFANPVARVNNHLHWNLLSQWEELKTGLRKAAAHQLEGIGVDTWGVDYGLIGPGDELLGQPYHYRDSRTDGMVQRAFDRVGRERIFNETGIQFMQLNTLYQVLAARESGSALLGAAETLLFMPDLFNFLFTGVRKSEYSIATTSQMYNPVKRSWATELLRDLGLPTKLLPEIVPSGTVIGPVLPDVAGECGVGVIPVIAPGGHDTASAVAAVPVEGGDNWCYISSGTWSLLGVEVPRPIINATTLKFNYTNEGAVGGGIRLLKNIMGLWLVQECRRHWIKEDKEYSYAELTKAAQESQGLQSLIDPDHAPFFSPGDMPVKIAEFCRASGQHVPSAPGEFVRACLDSLALTYRLTIDALEAILGREIRVIHIVGGGCQSELLNQMTADACGRTVVAGPIEATGIGNILAQAMATGQVANLSAARQIVRASFEPKRYAPRDTAQWDKAYERFKAIKK